MRYAQLESSVNNGQITVSPGKTWPSTWTKLHYKNVTKTRSLTVGAMKTPIQSLTEFLCTQREGTFVVSHPDPGGASILINCGIGHYYTDDDFESLDELLQLPFQRLAVIHLADGEIAWDELESRPLESLVWHAAMATASGDLSPGLPANGRFHLIRAPRLNGFPMRRRLVKIASYLRWQHANIKEIARDTEISESETKAFLNACYAAGILEVSA